MIIVSACLAGINCRYNGKNNRNEAIRELVQQGAAIPVCPEQLGGLPTPRDPAEISNGDGFDVLEGLTKVFTLNGQDVTSEYIKGAHEVLKMAKLVKAKEIILADKSPACGSTKIYNSGKIVPGVGVCAALLKKNGYPVKKLQITNSKSQANNNVQGQGSSSKGQVRSKEAKR